MDIKRLSISKKEIEKIQPEHERVFFLLMLNFVTEINVFQKLLLYSIKYPRSEIQKQAKVQMSINLLYVLAGKLYEGWKLIDETRHGSRKPKKGQPNKKFSENWFPIKYKSRLTPKGKKSLKFLENYFSHKNDLRTIRDQFSFHFDFPKAKKLFNKSNFDSISLYVPSGSGEIFSTANYVFLEEFFSELGQTSEQGFSLLLDNILNVSSNFTQIIADYAGIIRKDFLKDSEFESLIIPDPKPTGKMHLTFFSKP